MSVDITLDVKNINNVDYPEINLNKFFNMVFFSQDGRELHIYTATIFGTPKTSNPTSSTASSKADPPLCSLDFSYNCNKPFSVTSSDLSHSYLDQLDYVKKVWGKDCKKLEGQDAFTRYYEIVYGSNTSAPDVAKQTYWFIGNDGQSFPYSNIATLGKFNPNTDGYQLNNESNPFLEVVNWVKTTIKFEYNILEEGELNFRLQFSNHTDVNTPDFTWYFAPPSDYIVDAEKAKVKLGNSEEVNNLITPVADSTTVAFSQWIADEAISHRKKVRLYSKNCIHKDTFSKADGVDTLDIKINLRNSTDHGNRQFFLGLIVAFVLSYCSDLSRLNVFQTNCTYCADSACQCLIHFPFVNCQNMCNFLSILLPFIIVPSFFSYMIIPSRYQLLNQRKFTKLARQIGLISCTIEILYIFMFWIFVPECMRQLIPSCSVNQLIIFSLWTISFAANYFYLWRCRHLLKRHITDFL